MILYGEPGTGKTLLAKAVVSFFFLLFFSSKEKNKKNSPVFSLFSLLLLLLLLLLLYHAQKPFQANSTSATFLRVVGSELIQKYLGDGPKLVRELFKAADEMAPSIVFIDEVDAIGTKRYDSQSGGEREIQRTMLEVKTYFILIIYFFGESFGGASVGGGEKNER